MKYLLYLWRSMVRRPGRHLTLYSILTCAFLLPLVISIYRDSSAYGQEQYLLDWTKGAAYQITNASEADVHYFEDILGLSQPSYAEGTIYLSILSEEEWKNPKRVDNYYYEIVNKISLAGNQKLVITTFSYDTAHGISTDPAVDFEQRALFVFNLFIILASVLVAQSAYRSHLKHFSPEVGTLTSCGASMRQITNIFIVEYLIVFSLAAVSAILFSTIIMKLLFWFALEIKNVSGLAWLIFHINPVNTAFHLLIYFVTSAAALGITLWRYGRKSAWTLMRNDALPAQAIRRRQIDIAPPPAAALSRFWRSRTNGSLRSCVLITVPVMTIFLFLFNYLMLNIEVMTQGPEYELQMTRDVFQFEEIPQKDITCVEGIEGVRQVQPDREYILDETGITGSEVVNRLFIALEDPAMHDEIKAALQERFAQEGYRIIDRQEPVDYMRQISGGIYILMAYLFCILFLFALLILNIKICDYIEGCRQVIRSLYVIGASKQDLYRSYMRQILPASLTAAVVPIVISGILLVLVAASINVSALINGAAIVVYLVVAALVCGSYLYPAHCTLKSILQKL